MKKVRFEMAGDYREGRIVYLFSSNRKYTTQSKIYYHTILEIPEKQFRKMFKYNPSKRHYEANNPAGYILADFMTVVREGKIMSQTEIFERMEALIPADLWEKYKHLSFGEMAEVDELAEWADELRQAEKDWFEDA
jgi:hypothetical protein